MKDDRPTLEQWAAAARRLGCAPHAIMALGEVEAGPEGAFYDDGRPVILYEAHVFHRLTNGRCAAARVPDVGEQWAVLSRPKWKPGTYGPYSVQHTRLEWAAKCDRPAALKACSWGLFQLMGENHARCGYPVLQAFVNAMYKNVEHHLHALVNYCLADPALVRGLRDRAISTVSRRYNGPGYLTTGHHLKLGAAWAALERSSI